MDMRFRQVSWAHRRAYFFAVIRKLNLCTMASLTMLLIFFLVRSVNSSSLIFDQILFCGFITLLILLIAKRYSRKSLMSSFEAILLVAVITLVSQSIFLNIDRSRSFYVLSWIQSNQITYVNGELDISRVNSQEKNNESAIRNRIEEQLSRGLLIESQSDLALSFRGLLVLNASDYLAEIFNLNGWLQNSK